MNDEWPPGSFGWKHPRKNLFSIHPREDFVLYVATPRGGWREPTDNERKSILKHRGQTDGSRQV